MLDVCFYYVLLFQFSFVCTNAVCIVSAVLNSFQSMHVCVRFDVTQKYSVKMRERGREKNKIQIQSEVARISIVRRTFNLNHVLVLHTHKSTLNDSIASNFMLFSNCHWFDKTNECERETTKFSRNISWWWRNLTCDLWNWLNFGIWLFRYFFQFLCGMEIGS